jgi:Holliday junction resolvase RusA-like endonuclease
VQIKITIPGEPKAKARPRMSTKSRIAYTPKDTVMYENWVKSCYINQSGIADSEDWFKDQVNVRIDAYYSIPKSASKKKRDEMTVQFIRPIKKPDLDNIAKAILDSLNGIAYKDDSQVVSLIINKYYSDIPRVEVELWE